MANKSARAISPKEVKRLKAAANASRHAERNLAMIALGLGGGLRISEIVALTVGQITNAKGKVQNPIVLTSRQSKNAKSQRVYLSRSCAKAPEDYLNQAEISKSKSAPLFPSQKQGHMCACYGSQLITSLFKDAGILDATSHSLRKTWATTALKQGINIKVISKNLRHSNVSITSRYLDINDYDMKEACLGVSL